MKWPLEFTDQIIVNDPETQVAIISLWTKKEKIAEKLKENYAILGQLYSPEEGLNALIRNLLANKRIRDIIMVGADLSKSGDSLYFFFKNGVDEKHHIIGFDKVTIDEEIPVTILDELRKNVKLHDLREIKDFSELNEYIKNLEKKSSWGEPDVFPKKKIKPPETFPSERTGFILRGDYIYEVWIKILKTIMDFGTIKQSQYSEKQKEIIALTSVIEKEDPENPNIHHVFNFDEAELDSYYPQVLSDKKIDGVEYTYGQRLRNFRGIDQIDKIIEKIKKTNYTRRAVAFTWDVEKDYDSEKAPCLNFIQCIVQENKIYMTALFRSNDMYNAWPKNAFALRKLQKLISVETNFGMGPLTIISNSAHIYESSWKNAESVLEHFSLPHKRIGDPRGNIIIRTENDEIVVIRESPEGKRLLEIRGKTAFELYPKIKDYISEISHALYLGTELQKAEFAIKNKSTYIQDK